MKKKRFLKKWVAGTLLAGVLSMQMFAVPAFARLEEQLTVQNGQFIRANGTAIEGALAKGVTVSKYQNRAGTIDWGCGCGRRSKFCHDPSGISE